MSVRQITYREAMIEGFATAMRRDPGTFIVGEGIGPRGGCFVHTKGLYEEFGGERVIDVPISEAGFVGMCAGAAACGSRAVADMMYEDFLLLAMDQLVNQAAKIPYMSAGQFRMPLTINALFGIGGSAGAHHSQSLHPWFMYVPGVKVVMPSTPADLKGLLAGAILDDNVTVVLEHRLLLNLKGDVPQEDYVLPLGEAAVRREGAALTVAAAGRMVHEAMKAADTLAAEGVDAEVIDLRTLAPLDEQCIVTSVVKTGRLLVVDEGYAPCGVGAEVAAVVQQKAFDYLDAPIERLHTLSAPIPYSPPQEQYLLPDADKIAETARMMLR